MTNTVDYSQEVGQFSPTKVISGHCDDNENKIRN